MKPLKLYISSEGFTLVELMIVVAILAILAVGAMVALDPVTKIAKAGDSADMQSAQNIITAFNTYQASNGANPVTCDGVGGNPAANTKACCDAAVTNLKVSNDLKGNYSLLKGKTAANVKCNIVSGNAFQVTFDNRCTGASAKCPCDPAGVATTCTVH